MARDALEWREPWRASIARQPRFNPAGRAVVRDFGIWLLVSAAMAIEVRWQLATSPRQAASIAAMAAGVAATLALVTNFVLWLSPQRSVRFWPHGILVSHWDATLLTWDRIAGFDMPETEPPVLRLQLVDGTSEALLLDEHVDRSAVSSALRRNLDGVPGA